MFSSFNLFAHIRYYSTVGKLICLNNHILPNVPGAKAVFKKKLLSYLMLACLQHAINVVLFSIRVNKMLQTCEMVLLLLYLNHRKPGTVSFVIAVDAKISVLSILK